MSDLFIGVDLGGTKIDIGLVDRSGKMIDHILIPTQASHEAHAIVADIAKAIEQLKTKTQATIQGIGVGMAGQIDKETGAVHFAPNLGWREFPLREELEKATHFPVAVTNDVRAAAWGEWLYGAGRGCDDLICLFIGTGIGGGIVSGGKMLLGASNTAGEVGHITLDLHGPVCACGNHGCFEALAGGRAIGMRTQEFVAKDPKAGAVILELAGEIGNIKAEHLFAAYKKNDPLAVKIVEGMKEALNAGVASLVNAFNPQRLILGGGVIQHHPFLFDAIVNGFAKRALKTPAEAVQIVGTALKAEAGVIGAAAMMIGKEEGK